MKLLLTGVAGFIGSNLCKSLLDKKFHVVGIDSFDNFYSRSIKEQNILDLRRYPNFNFFELNVCEELHQIKNESFDVIIHLASKVGVLPSISDIDACLQTNIIGTKNILELARHNKVKNVIFSSSSTVYGSNSNKIFSENDCTDLPLTPYGSSKKACELLLYNYFNLFNINAIILRLFSVYGKNQRPDLAFHKFSTKIKANQIVEIYGDGNSQRDYTEINDVIESILLAIEYITKNDEVYEIFNIGSANPISINDVVSKLYEIYHKEPNLVYIDRHPGDMTSTFANISKAKNILGYYPRTNFENGIKNFCKWFMESQQEPNG
ncbi:MAG: GDP-mannose 4,6-dehydratase [Sphingobacteriia bacterium]|nr:GDP-mannose 4,6-dehydratase [Sphingobacteriia bacterium]